MHINAALHGFSRRETLRLPDDIEEFAGLGDIMAVPLQYFSSGMQARLSYAVAAHLKPDVLLVDEVLAVATSPTSAGASTTCRSTSTPEAR